MTRQPTKTGHTDTVPLGARAWNVPPHEGLVKEGRLLGAGRL